MAPKRIFRTPWMPCISCEPKESVEESIEFQAQPPSWHPMISIGTLFVDYRFLCPVPLPAAAPCTLPHQLPFLSFLFHTNKTAQKANHSESYVTEPGSKFTVHTTQELRELKTVCSLPISTLQARLFCFWADGSQSVSNNFQMTTVLNGKTSLHYEHL